MRSLGTPNISIRAAHLARHEYTIPEDARMSYDPNQPNEQNQPPPQPDYQPPTQYTPPPEYNQPYAQQPAYGQPPYGGVPPVPTYVPPQRSSLRWLWITLAVVGGILVLGCGGCIIASVAGLGIFGRAVSTAIAPSATANSYYNAIKKQDYGTAFTYLDISGASVEGQQVSKDAFIILGQTIDATKGPVSSFNQSGISLNTSTSSGNTATVTMDVTRNGSTYTVHLELRQENNVWKITSVDNI